MIGEIAKAILGSGKFVQKFFQEAENPRWWGKAARGRMTNQVLMNFVLPSALTYAFTPKNERVGAIAGNAAVFALTAGMSPGRQAWAGLALTMAPEFGAMLRGIKNSYRSGLEARSSMSVPFSHSSLNMDLALAQLQYASSRVSDAYRTVGGEAAFMAARFMSR